MNELAGLLHGFLGRTSEIRTENAERAKADDAREQNILLTLANHADDDEIRSAAVMGLLSGQDPKAKKKSGIRGWYGEMNEHPAMAGLRNLISGYKRVDGPAPTMPGASAALPDQALTQGGTPGGVPGGVVPQPPGGLETEGTVNLPLSPEAEATYASYGQQFNTPAPPPGPHYQKRRVFLSPVEKAAQEAEATYGGRLQGLVRGANAGGAHLTSQDVTEMARGMAGAPRRSANSRLVNVQLADGSTSVANYNPQDQTLTDIEGIPMENVVRIMGTASGSAGATTRTVRDPNSKTGYAAVRLDNAGNELWRLPDVPAPTEPLAYGNMIETSGGIYGLPRGGNALVPVPGGQNLNAVDPNVYFNSLANLGNQMEGEANAMVPALGALGRNPQRVAAAKDQVAKAYGFKGGWADYQKATAEAAAGVQRGAQPPTARPATPPQTVQPPDAMGQTIDVNKVLEQLRRQRASGAQR